MQSTINFALSNAFAKLNISPEIADRTIAHLWRPVTPPKSVNLDKLNRQQVQRLEQMKGDETDKSTLQKSFLTYVNGLDTAAFKSLSLVEHMEDFLQSDEDVVDVNFHLNDYVVGIKSHRVYELRGGVHVYVGILGMNNFQDMIMPEIEDD
jgi:hypothetical protein